MYDMTLQTGAGALRVVPYIEQQRQRANVLPSLLHIELRTPPRSESAGACWACSVPHVPTCLWGEGWAALPLQQTEGVIGGSATYVPDVSDTTLVSCVFRPCPPRRPAHARGDLLRVKEQRIL